MRAFLKHMQQEVKRKLPALNLRDPGLTIRITASVPETATRHTLNRFKALLEEVWSTYCGMPATAKVAVVITREPFAAALAVQKDFYACSIKQPVPGTVEVRRWERMIIAITHVSHLWLCAVSYTGTWGEGMIVAITTAQSLMIGGRG